MEANKDNGRGTINIDKVLAMLEGARKGMEFAFPDATTSGPTQAQHPEPSGSVWDTPETNLGHTKDTIW